jgi:hypothetical protein
MTLRLFALALAVGAPALAQVSATCDQPRELDKYQLLRRLSLDLRGRAPSVEEYQALDAQASVPVATVRAYLGSDDFRQVMRRQHEEFFWPNVTNVQLNGTNAQLNNVGTAADPIYAIASTGKRRLFRGLADVSTALGAQCGDFQQTQFTAGFVPAAAGIRTTTVNGTTVRQEGWRLVTPYWAPGTQVKVCAFDAMETPTVTAGTRTYDCATNDGDGRAECGCGPNLRWCYGPTGQVRSVIHAAMREQLLRMVDKVTTGGEAYTTLLTSRTAPINGPLAFWRRNLAPHLTYARVVALPDPNETLPTLAFTDTTWQEVDRGSPLHAGVLTTPAYLLRFQTNRGRANRFRQDFECESFVPPSALESPAADGCSDSSSDLTKRCTCRYCHRQLEPMAALWGQFAEAGVTLMTNRTMFPRTNSSCINSTSAFCRRFYVTDHSDDAPGSLLAWQYADAAHPDITQAITAGPKSRVDAAVANGAFARCTVRRTWATLMKRELRLVGTDPDEAAAVQSLATGFAANGYRLPWLVEQVVSHPSYRRIR